MALVLGIGLAACGGHPAVHERVELLDAAGQTVDAFAGLDGGPATVFVFTRTDCPVSNRYAPELERLAEEFGPRGVRFRLVYPGAGVDPAAIDEHLREYGFTMPALRDPALKLAQFSGATITPEVAVYVPGGELVYRGRIDDRYVDFGQVRPRPTRRDLARALEAVLAGQPVEVPRTEAIGCFIADLR